MNPIRKAAARSRIAGPRPVSVRIAVFAACTALLALLPAQTPRLAYLVEALGSAKTALLIEGGAEGSAWALGLRVTDKDWARWNLPAFPASPACTGLAFQARLATVPAADGQTKLSRSPSAFQVRMVEADGSEWQGEKLDALEAGWKKFSVSPDRFQYFRGSDRRKGTAFKWSQAVQVQFVLIGAAPGEGVDIDSVRLGPSAPAWTFDSGEHRSVTSAAEAQRARTSMMYGSLMAEKERLDGCARWAQEAGAGLKALLDSQAPQETLDAITTKLSGATRGKLPAYLENPPGGVGAYEPRTLPLSDAEVKRLAPLMLDLGDASGWKSSTLYLAKPQGSPARLEEDGREGIGMDFRFTDASKQVIFLEGPTFAPVNVSGYRAVEVLAKLDAAPLNEASPLCLRLLSGENPSDFADYKAEAPLPAGRWTNFRFVLGKPFQGGGSYQARQLSSFRFRFQNKEETPARFRFLVAQIRFLPPDSAQAATERALSAAYAQVAESKLAAWSALDGLRQMRERVRSNAVVGAWLSRAQRAAARRPMAYPALPSLPGLTLSARLDASGSGEVFVRYAEAGASAEGGEVEVLDHRGMAAAKSALAPDAADRKALSARLVVANVHPWSPAYPYLYRLRVRLRGGAAPLLERELGFRNITVGSSPLSPTLRHAWGEADWEGSMLLNGQPYFPYGAYYGLPKGKNLGDVAPLLRELWVDALREYGFSFKPERIAFGDREGIGAYASIAPPYKNIADWDSLNQVFADWSKRLEALGPELGRPSVLNWQVGNEVELDMWGASLADSCPEAPWLPLERAAVLARGLLPPAPITYVRAGALSPIPVLAGEDLAGINQYTGRYGGRITEIGAHLEQYARHARASCRSLGITEWNGPQYSWAANGIGGVTERGSAYYVQRYFETMIDTPGIGLSSEFTLNWVLWRTENLTTRTKEEEWKDRPPYEGFGGGYSADHVPILSLEQVYRGEVFRAFRGMQSPLYALLRAPGDLVVAHAPEAKAFAQALVNALAPFGRKARALELAPGASLAGVDSHVILIGGVARAQPAAVLEWEKAGVLDEALEGFPSRSLPLIERRLHPNFPMRGLVYVSGADEAARRDGVRALEQAAADIAELWKREGAMVRVVALTDARGAASYERLTFEFVGRGHLLGGDDTRERLVASEFLQADGKRKAAWWNLHALILDAPRALGAEEWGAARALAKSGVRLLVSEPCLAANKAIADYLGVQEGAPRSLTESVRAGEAWQGPIPVNEVGQIKQAVIERFQPGSDPKTLQVSTLRGGTPLAWMENDRSPIAVKVERDGGTYAVLGYALGEVSALHRRVAVSGKTHSYYDRDTACGLERPGRFALNLCLEGRQVERILPRLRAVAQLNRGLLSRGERATLLVRIRDMEGRLVPGAVAQCRVQGMVQAKPQGQASEYRELVEVAPGLYQAELGAGPRSAGTKNVLWVDDSNLAGEGLKALSAQIRVMAPGHIAWEGGCSAWVKD